MTKRATLTVITRSGVHACSSARRAAEPATRLHAGVQSVRGQTRFAKSDLADRAAAVVGRSHGDAAGAVVAAPAGARAALRGPPAPRGGALIRRAAGARSCTEDVARLQFEILATPSPAARRHARATSSSACRTSSAPRAAARARTGPSRRRGHHRPGRLTRRWPSHVSAREATSCAPPSHKAPWPSPPPRRESPKTARQRAVRRAFKLRRSTGGALFDRHHTPRAAAAAAAARVAEMAHATNNISANLHDVLKIEKEQIRGITVVSLLSGSGQPLCRRRPGRARRPAWHVCALAPGRVPGLVR